MIDSPPGEPTVADAPELSRPVEVGRLPPEGRTLTLEATEAECRALATRFAVDAVESLCATVSLRPLGSKRPAEALYEVRGTMTARVRQTCVVTLEPLTRTLTETVCQRFGGSAPVGGDTSEVDVDPEAAVDPPEPIIEGCVDAGELIAEVLGLAVDPHPRADGAVFERPDSASSAAMSRPDPLCGPFAALANLACAGGSQKNGT